VHHSAESDAPFNKLSRHTHRALMQKIPA